MARTHVILSDEVITAIDERVGERGRSRFLEEAAREKLERLELEAAIREGSGVLKDRDYPHWRDSESAQEWVRRSRRGELTADDLPAR
jgi:metal-responsive CopG/Arc/MetJ family transcriptional regulator